MIEIIETNISGPIMEDRTSISIVDHQSRIIKADSWEEYVSLYLDPESEILREKFPDSLLKQAKISNLVKDDFHLRCIIQKELSSYPPTYRLAYIKGRCF